MASESAAAAETVASFWSLTVHQYKANAVPFDGCRHQFILMTPKVSLRAKEQHMHLYCKCSYQVVQGVLFVPRPAVLLHTLLLPPRLHYHTCFASGLSKYNCSAAVSTQAHCQQFTASFMALQTFSPQSNQSVMPNVAMEPACFCSNSLTIESGLDVLLAL